MIRCLIIGTACVMVSSTASMAAPLPGFDRATRVREVAQHVGYEVGYGRGRAHVDREHCSHSGDHDHCHTDHIVVRRRWHGDHLDVERRRYHDDDDHVHEHYEHGEHNDE